MQKMTKEELTEFVNKVSGEVSGVYTDVSNTGNVNMDKYGCRQYVGKKYGTDSKELHEHLSGNIISAYGNGKNVIGRIWY